MMKPILLVLLLSIVPACEASSEFAFDGNLALGTTLVFFGGLLCAGGGIGGGGVYIPIFVLILGFSPHEAIPLSKVTIVGVAIGANIINARRRHPFADRPLVDGDAVCVMEPMTVVGTSIGVFANVVFPSDILIIFLVLLLTICSYRAFKKGFRRHALEKLGSATTLDAEGGVGPISDYQQLNSGGRSVSRSAHYSGSSARGDRISYHGPESRKVSRAASHRVSTASMHDTAVMRKVDKITKQERGYPIMGLVSVACCLAILLLFALLKGSTTGHSIIGATCGTLEFWLLVVAPVPICMATSFYHGVQHNKKYSVKCASGWQFVDGDVLWTPLKAALFPLFSMFAGTAAGLLGIGGGLVQGPFLLEMGLLPQVVTATSSFMILFTATSTSVQFMILGRLLWRYALWYAAVGFLASVCGNMGVVYLVKKYNKQSYIAFLIGSAVGLSVIAMVASFIVQQQANGVSFAFNPLCGSTA